MHNITTVSQLASIHPAAQIGNNVTIEPFAVIGADVVIGDNTWIGSHAVVNDGARIGNNCRIFHGAVIASLPQDLKYNGEYSTVEIRDNVSIREYATINRGTAYSYKTVIEENVLVMAYVHLAHDCHIERNVILANSVNLAGHVRVGEFAVVGGMVGVHQFCQIGKHAMISGGSLVGKDVPPYVLAGREPLSYRGVNYRGLKRRGYSNETVREIQEIYRLIFLSGLNNTQALKRIEETFPVSMERDEILEFVRGAERGIIRGYSFLRES
jgi:UDP-N-acetylglucosamine acyltransferase